ncbi:response regulator transcription factor [Sphingomonas aerolata]|uniref:response regulator transcription factor n=1 Tax=Sphingomonas aerolata TaxID=185951 RepID=UPI003A5BBF73
MRTPISSNPCRWTRSPRRCGWSPRAISTCPTWSATCRRPNRTRCGPRARSPGGSNRCCNCSSGASNKEIAHALNLAEGTIKVHLSGLFKALGVHNRTGAVASVHAQAY